VNESALQTNAGPWLHLMVSAPNEAWELCRRLERSQKPKTAARRLRGDKMLKKPELMDEIAAALQFPPTFGHNWDGLNDCLCDLMWLPADRHVLVVAGTPHLLKKEPAALKPLIELLRDIGAFWSQSGHAFHTVFQCDPNDEAATHARLTAACVSPTDLNTL
jgi:hypothetical protein